MISQLKTYKETWRRENKYITDYCICDVITLFLETPQAAVQSTISAEPLTML
jgi:hypothetical protein